MAPGSDCHNGRGTEDSERTPLIAPRVNNHEPRQPSQPSPGKPPRTRQFGIVFACIAFLILTELGAYLATIPLNQVLEENICRDFDPGLPVRPNDPRCKEKAVQTELSMIRGWQNTFDIIPGLLTAIPYGLVADKHGRELVLRLCLLGVTLSNGFYILVCALPTLFPPRLTWLSSIFTLVGGGSPVLNAMMFTITNDVVSEQQRSTTFFYLGAAVIAGELVSSPLVYVLMEVNLWIPIYLGLGCLALATMLAFFLPETIPTEAAAPQQPTEATEPFVARQGSDSPRWLHTARAELRRLGEAARWFARENGQIVALLCTLLMTTVGRFAQELLAQYVTKRYGWSWSQASFLLFIRAFFTLVLFAAILPSASYAMVRRWSFSAQTKDLWLARASALLLALGAFGMGLAQTSVLMAVSLGFHSLGSGYGLLTRSLLASVVEKHHVGMLYTMISVLETVGLLVAGPLLAVSYRTGLNWEGPWIGLPYITAGCLFASATVTIGLVSVSRLERKGAAESVGAESPE